MQMQMGKSRFHKRGFLRKSLVPSYSPSPPPTQADSPPSTRKSPATPQPLTPYNDKPQPPPANPSKQDKIPKKLRHFPLFPHFHPLLPIFALFFDVSYPFPHFGNHATPLPAPFSRRAAASQMSACPAHAGCLSVSVRLSRPCGMFVRVAVPAQKHQKTTIFSSFSSVFGILGLFVEFYGNLEFEPSSHENLCCSRLKDSQPGSILRKPLRRLIIWLAPPSAPREWAHPKLVGAERRAGGGFGEETIKYYEEPILAQFFAIFAHFCPFLAISAFFGSCWWPRRQGASAPQNRSCLRLFPPRSGVPNVRLSRPCGMSVRVRPPVPPMRDARPCGCSRPKRPQKRQKHAPNASKTSNLCQNRHRQGASAPCSHASMLHARRKAAPPRPPQSPNPAISQSRNHAIPAPPPVLRFFTIVILLPPKKPTSWRHGHTASPFHRSPVHSLRARSSADRLSCPQSAVSFLPYSGRLTQMR